MFKLVLIHLSDQEVCNVYRSRGNTTAACKHVTRNLFFSSFFFFLIQLFFCPPPSLPSPIQVTLNPNELLLAVAADPRILTVVKEQT